MKTPAVEAVDGDVLIDSIQELSTALHQQKFNLMAPGDPCVGKIDGNTLGAAALEAGDKLENIQSEQ